MPSPEQVFDLAAFSSLLAALLDSEDRNNGLIETGAAVFSVQHRPREGEGGASWIRPMATEVDGGMTEALTSALGEALTAPASESTRLSFRLRVDLSSDPQLQTAPSLHCAPVLSNREQINRLTAELGRETLTGGTAVVDFLVPAEGPPQVEALVSSSGSGTLDRAILDVARRARFDPGHIDGFPLRIHARVPFTVTPGG